VKTTLVSHQHRGRVEDFSPEILTTSPYPCWLACRRYTLRVRLYRPRSASLLQTFTSWLTGMPAEFSDPKFPSYGEGREGEYTFWACCCALQLPSIYVSLRQMLAAASHRALNGSQQGNTCVVSCMPAVTRVVSSGHVNIQVNILTKVRCAACWQQSTDTCLISSSQSSSSSEHKVHDGYSKAIRATVAACNRCLAPVQRTGRVPYAQCAGVSGQKGVTLMCCVFCAAGLGCLWLLRWQQQGPEQQHASAAVSLCQRHLHCHSTPSIPAIDQTLGLCGIDDI
jgi:hypothetical protein